MLLEVKSNQKGYQKAKKQLFDGKARLEELLAAIGLKNTFWKYIGVFNAQIPDKLPLFNCKKCSIFAIIGDSIPENLKIIEDEVDKLQENWNPADHINEFVDIATHLLFVVQGDSRAPVTRSNIIDKTVKHVERASKLEYIFHWTPDQLSLVQALELSYVLIDAFYSTGKTEVLKYYGKTKKREQGEILHYFNHRPMKMKGSLNLLPFTLMLQGEFPEGVVKETTFQFGVDSIDAFLQEHGIEADHHVIFDEVICTKYTKAFVDSLVKMKNSVRSLWIAMGAEPVIGKKISSRYNSNMN